MNTKKATIPTENKMLTEYLATTSFGNQCALVVINQMTLSVKSHSKISIKLNRCNKEVKNTASQNDLQMCYQIYAVMLMKNLFQIGPSPKLPLSLDMCKLVLSWSQQPYNHQFRVC